MEFVELTAADIAAAGSSGSSDSTAAEAAVVAGDAAAGTGPGGREVADTAGAGKAAVASGKKAAAVSGTDTAAGTSTARALDIADPIETARTVSGCRSGPSGGHLEARAPAWGRRALSRKTIRRQKHSDIRVSDVAPSSVAGSPRDSGDEGLSSW